MTLRASLERQRAAVRPLLDDNTSADALAYYYALQHSPERTELFVHPESAESYAAPATGFLVRARTGMDLFRPLVTFRAPSATAAKALLLRGLLPGRPVYLTVPESHAGWANQYLDMSEAELHAILRFDPKHFEAEINVLVVTHTGTDGLPRCEIRSGERAGAVAGINWQSPRYAEVYVYTEAAVRGRGWGKAVVRALLGQILKSGRTPLYVVAESNEYSIRLAEAVGFVPTGHREYVGQAIRLG